MYSRAAGLANSRHDIVDMGDGIGVQTQSVQVAEVKGKGEELLSLQLCHPAMMSFLPSRLFA